MLNVGNPQALVATGSGGPERPCQHREAEKKSSARGATTATYGGMLVHLFSGLLRPRLHDIKETTCLLKNHCGSKSCRKYLCGRNRPCPLNLTTSQHQTTQRNHNRTGTGWRSDLVSPWTRYHAGGSWQDTSGALVPERGGWGWPSLHQNTPRATQIFRSKTLS